MKCWESNNYRTLIFLKTWCEISGEWVNLKTQFCIHCSRSTMFIWRMFVGSQFLKIYLGEISSSIEREKRDSKYSKALYIRDTWTLISVLWDGLKTKRCFLWTRVQFNETLFKFLFYWSNEIILVSLYFWKFWSFIII